MATQKFYDRVEIYIDGVPYLPNGQIRTFRMNASYRSSQLKGYTPDGKPVGQIVGGSEIESISWVEYLGTETQYLNWRTFLIANPDTVITVLPVSLATNVQSAASFSILGVNCTGQGIDNAGESEATTRACTFNGSDSTNL